MIFDTSVYNKDSKSIPEYKCVFCICILTSVLGEKHIAFHLSLQVDCPVLERTWVLCKHNMLILHFLNAI